MRKRIRVRVWNDRMEVTGYTRDISSSGFFMEAHKLPQVGMRLHVEFTLENGLCYFESQVARVQREPADTLPILKSGMGLRFVPFDEAAETVLENPVAVPAPCVLRLNLKDLATFNNTYENQILHGGLFIPSNLNLERDQEVSVSLSLPEHHGAIVVTGRVIHVMKQPMAGISVLLTDLPSVLKQLQPLRDTRH